MTSRFVNTLLLFSLFFFTLAYTASPPVLDSSQDVKSGEHIPPPATIYRRQGLHASSIASENASQTYSEPSLYLDEASVHNKRGKRKGKKKPKKKKQQGKGRRRTPPKRARKPPRKAAKKIQKQKKVPRQKKRPSRNRAPKKPAKKVQSKTVPRQHKRPLRTKPRRKPAKKIKPRTVPKQHKRPLRNKPPKKPARKVQTKTVPRPNKRPLRNRAPKKPAKKVNQKTVPKRNKNKRPSKRCKSRRIACKADCKKRNKKVGCKAVAPTIKLCTKKVREEYPCPGQKLPMCKVVEKEPAVCKRTVSKTMPCSRKANAPKEICKTKSIQVYCKPKECSLYEGVKCVYGTVKGPCESKRGRCNDCVGKYRLRHCTKTHTRRNEVACPPNIAPRAEDPVVAPRTENPAIAPRAEDPAIAPRAEDPVIAPRAEDPVIAPRAEDPVIAPRAEDPVIAPRAEDPGTAPRAQAPVAAPASFPASNTPVSPTPTPTPRPFEDAVMFASNVRCLASLFDEEECYHSDMSCQLFAETFDSTACAVQVCHDCKQLRYMPVSPGLKRYCFELLESSCRTLYSFDQSIVSRVDARVVSARVSSRTLPSGVTYDPSDGKCYKVEQKEVSAPCNVLLSPNEHCVSGCIVGTCEKKIRRTHFCKDNLPPSCHKRKLNKCRKKQKECTVVKEDPALCKFQIPVEYACEKKKTVSKPCITAGAKAFGKLGPQGGFAGQLSKHAQGRLKGSMRMCARTVKQKYVCGKRNVVKSASCVQKGCRARRCETITC